MVKQDTRKESRRPIMGSREGSEILAKLIMKHGPREMAEALAVHRKP